LHSYFIYLSNSNCFKNTKSSFSQPKLFADLVLDSMDGAKVILIHQTSSSSAKCRVHYGVTSATAGDNSCSWCNIALSSRVQLSDVIIVTADNYCPTEQFVYFILLTFYLCAFSQINKRFIAPNGSWIDYLFIATKLNGHCSENKLNFIRKGIPGNFIYLLLFAQLLHILRCD